MIPELEIIKPFSLEEAVDFLNDHPAEARIIAGGTDIIPGLMQGSKRFTGIKYLVDLQQIDELKEIIADSENITIGALLTFSQMINNDSLKNNFPLLVKSASTVGSVQIRNRATVAGNFINNAPCADSVPPLLVYNAKIKLLGVNGNYEMPLSDFLIKPYFTRLKTGEIVTQIILPKPKKEFIGDFYKLGRRRGVAISRITLAALIQIEDNKLGEIRLASGAVSPIGMRFFDLEQKYSGSVISDKLLKNISSDLGKEILKVTGLRWSSEYKVPVTQQAMYLLLERICSAHKQVK
ncbi:MAG: xanthine dehydrogenase family protein subunit M [Ignavibacteriaceae bacterium]|nr:xanthine dehydrogenase family protein subunit M [Ignavibacteriaceae bacterium]